MLRLKLLTLAATIILGTSGVLAENDAINLPTFSVKGIKVPKNHYYLIALDRGEPGNIDFTKPGAKNWKEEKKGKAGLVAVSARKTLNDVVLEVGIEPRKNKNLKGEQEPSDWTIKVNAEWSERKVEATKNYGNKLFSLTFTPKWKYTGSAGLSFVEPAETKFKLKTVKQPDGSDRNKAVTYSIEETFPIKLEEMKTGNASVVYYRIPFTSVNGVKKAVVILIADEMKKLSDHVRVQQKGKKFRWTDEWFSPIAKPFLDDIGKD